MFTRDENADRDIKRGINAGNSIDWGLNAFGTNKKLSKDAKLNGMLVPILMYGWK